MPKGLAAAIESSRAALIETWRQRVIGAVSPAGARTAEIVDSLPDFLDQLVEALRRAQTESVQRSQLAAQHGSQRFHAGFSLGAVVREYRVLHDCLFDLIREQKIPVSPAALQIVAERITSAIADAVEEYTRQRDQAVQRAQEQHMAFVAHELRNPLSSARLALEVLRRTLPAPPPAALDRVQQGVSRAQELIDQSLLSIRMRSFAGDLELRREQLDLTELARAALEEVSGDAEDKGITLVCEAPGPIQVGADRRLILSAMGNLIRNAVKFTHPGGRVLVRLHSGEGRASFEVEDRCNGLPPGKVEELFSPFVQRGADRSGFGLGLAITKQAVEAHGGSVQVHNLPGVGCVFMFDLPLGQIDEE